MRHRCVRTANAFFCQAEDIGQCAYQQCAYQRNLPVEALTASARTISLLPARVPNGGGVGLEVGRNPPGVLGGPWQVFLLRAEALQLARKLLVQQPVPDGLQVGHGSFKLG